MPEKKIDATRKEFFSGRHPSALQITIVFTLQGDIDQERISKLRAGLFLPLAPFSLLM